jgi:AcrR family transcriptional regulator
MTERARLPVDERRAQLLAVGLELFGERPYEDVSIDEVAERVGISKGLLYHYFPSKKAFYLATMRAAAEHMRALTEPRPKETPVEELRASLDAYLDYIEKHAAGYKAVLRARGGRDPQLLTLVEEFRAAMVDRILLGLHISHPSPMIRLVSRGWLGFVESASLDWLDRRDLPRERLRELFVETLVYTLSIAARPPR